VGVAGCTAVCVAYDLREIERRGDERAVAGVCGREWMLQWSLQGMLQSLLQVMLPFVLRCMLLSVLPLSR